MSISKPIECYETTHSAAMGISFQINPQRHIFLPYALLLSIELVESTEMIFWFSVAEVTVSGENLDRLYQVATETNLSRILTKSSVSDAKRVWVRQIAVKESTKMNHLSLEKV